jgi:hypothetical protein
MVNQLKIKSFEYLHFDAGQDITSKFEAELRLFMNINDLVPEDIISHSHAIRPQLMTDRKDLTKQIIVNTDIYTILYKEK